MSSGDDVTTSGHRKSFHTDRNVSTATVLSGGPISGSRIAAEDPQPAGAVDQRRLLELDGQRQEELPQQVDPERRHQVGHDQRRQRVDQAAGA